MLSFYTVPFTLDMPERQVPDKSLFISAHSTTRFTFYDYTKEDTLFDTNSVYETKSDKFQSLSLDIFSGEERRFGIASNVDLYSIGKNDFNLKMRTQILHASLSDKGIFKKIILGRQNSFTGFNFYKIDGLSSTIALGKNMLLAGFLGLQVGKDMGIGQFNDMAGFIKVSHNFGYRSYLSLSFERSMYDNTIIANDLGLDFNFNIQKRLSLNTKAHLSFNSGTKLSEIQFRAQYRISRMHHPYIGYQLHNPTTINPMTFYFYDIFNYQKLYGGWRFKPFKKLFIYFIGEYGLLSIHNLTAHNIKLSFLSPYFDALYTQRFGDLNGAGLINVSAKWPFHKMFTIGAGFDYVNMESVYDENATLYDYYGFLKFTPFKEVLFQTRLENRSDKFYKQDMRVLIELRIGYSNRYGDLFRKRGNN